MPCDKSIQIGNVHLLNPFGNALQLKDNVQGTFQLCGKTGIGMMHLDDERGHHTIYIGWELGQQILAAMEGKKEA